MNTLKALLIIPVMLFSLAFIAPQTVHADPDDDAALEQVENWIAYLWEYVDGAADTPDAEFYPAFATEVSKVHTSLDEMHADLAKTTETGDAKQTVEQLRVDIRQMQEDLGAWHAAALKADSQAFEAAGTDLNGTLDTYATHLDEYEEAAYTKKAIREIVAHALPFVVSFAATTGLIAWAIHKNRKTDDLMQEIKRQLRWHVAIGSIVITVGTALPLIFYMATDSVVLWWHWGLAFVGIALWLVAAARFVRATYLYRRHV